MYLDTSFQSDGWRAVFIGGSQFAAPAIGQPSPLYYQGSPQCFPAGTEVLLASGRSVAIENIALGAFVASYADVLGGALVGRRVVRLFASVTDVWLRLSNGLVVTPGHHFASPAGGFRTIESILAGDGLIILADGTVSAVSGEDIHYSEETAGLFEEAEGYLSAETNGATASAPKFIRGWKTYNFEVEELHTYVAGGVRVHNTSVIIGSGRDVPVGRAVGPNGETLYVNPNGTVTNLDTGYTAPGPQGHISSNPELDEEEDDDEPPRVNPVSTFVTEPSAFTT